MIKRLRQSPLDKQYLAVREYVASPININFNNLVVNKPWGSEYLMYSNSETELWNLYISHQKSTSMHCHPNKKTALMVVEGRALFSTLNESIELHPLDIVVMGPGIFHSTQAVSPDGLRVLEFENPPMKHDLLRLEDKYGRVNNGYEGKEAMTASGLSSRFTKQNLNTIRKIHSKKMAITVVNSHSDIKKLANKGMELAILISGSVKSGSIDKLFLFPYAITIEELNNLDCTFDNTTIFTIGRT